MEKQNHINQTQNTDRIFEEKFQSVKSFAFDQQVTEVFADMIKRSVPGYDSILKSIAMYCMQYAQDNTNIYDLGCSLGAVAVTAAKATQERNCQIIAVDTSEPMVNECRKIIENKALGDKIRVSLQDVNDMKITNASVVVSNFTLQFIPRNLRKSIVAKIYKGLNSGGVFILSEKFKSEDDKDRFLIEHYHAYKKINGYSHREIERKRQALKDVLIPDSEADIEQRLSAVGFQQVIKWFQCFNFASYVAIKS